MPVDPRTGQRLPYGRRTPGNLSPNDPWADDDVETAQDYAREGVMGFGESLRPELLRQIGTTLGGLNEIGALRSGAVPVHLGEVGERYGQQVGAYAKMATGEAVGHGLEASRQRFEREEAERRRKRSLMQSIGMALGTAVGFIANPLLSRVGRSGGDA